MLALIVAVAASAGAAFVAGLFVGRRRGADLVARRIFDDRDTGRAVLERLAAVHGARLEMVVPPVAVEE